MNWKNEIEEIFKLATLHSWCTQVDQLIEKFNVANPEAKHITSYLQKILTERNSPREHYIISLVLLNHQNYPIDGIIELSINALYSKLNKNDILFLKKHLFQGNFPLSADLSEDITNRSFLSPKVAIKKAMKIDSVISKNNPMKTVLYMNFILSRMDMNEENRAMVAFLLLRVDINLPKNLQKKVFKYLMAYKDIIKELLEEESGETVDIDDIYGIQNKITKIEIIEEKNVQKKKLDSIIEKENISEDELPTEIIPKLSVPSVAAIELEKSIIEISKTSKKSKSLPKKKSSKNIISKSQTKSLEITKKDNFLKETKAANTDNRLKPSIKKEKISKIETTRDSFKLQFKENENFSEKNKTDENDEKYSNGIQVDETNIIKNSFNNIELKDKKKSWDISLKQSKSILESILAGITKSKSKAGISNKIMKLESTKEVEKNTFNKFIVKKKIFGILLIAAAFISFFFIYKYIKINNPVVVPVTTNIETKVLKPDEIPLEAKSDLVSTAVEKSNLKNVDIPDNFPFDITIVDRTIKWKVVSGDSITGFFFALQDFRKKLETTELEKISKLDWDQFFETFKNNNSVRDSYHIIFPNEVFILPLD